MGIVLCLLCLIAAFGTTSSSLETHTISIEGLAAVTATKYTWSVSTATHPGGLSLAVGHDKGSLLVSSNYTRTAAGTISAVSGTIKIANPTNTDVRLTIVQAVIQQPAAGSGPTRSIAECFRDLEGYVTISAGQTLACPFVQLLASRNTSPVIVQAQAAVAGAGQLLGPSVTVLFSSRTPVPKDNSAAALALGRCAVLSDTFMSGDLYLTPSGVAAGIKMPSLGAAGAICGTTTSLYKITFGPFASNTMCGAYQVVNTARANPLGGDQAPDTASSLVLVSITGCPAPSPPPAAATAAVAATTSYSSKSNMRLAADSIIFGPQAPSSAPPSSAASGDPYTDSPRSATSTNSAIVSAPDTQPDVPAVPPAPAPASPVPPASKPDNGYYYTYEYEAQIPSTARHRKMRRRLMAGSGDVGVAASISKDRTNAAAVGDAAAVSAHQQHQRHLPNWVPWHADHSLVIHKNQQPYQQQESTQLQASRQERATPAEASAALVSTAKQLQYQQTMSEPASAVPGDLQQTTQMFASPGMEQMMGLGSTRMLYNMQTSFDSLSNSSTNALEHKVLFVGLSQGGKLQVQDSQQQEMHSRQLVLQPELLLADGSTSPLHQQQPQTQWPQMPQPLLALRNARKQLTTRRLQHDSSPPGPQFIAASTFYGPSAVVSADQPSVAFTAMQVGFSVMGFAWEPEVLVSPAAATVQVGNSTSFQYSVKVTRTELPRRTLLRGALVITNPLSTVLQLSEVAVEAPAAGKPSWAYVTAACGQGGTLASILSTPVVKVPARGQVTCTFSASYPGAAPSNGVLFATAVTEAGRQLVSDGFAFTRPATEVAAPQAAKLGACALFSDTFLTSADSTLLLTPSQLPEGGSKAPAAVDASRTGGPGGVLLCNNASYVYSVEVGPSADCGTFQVLSHLRLHPLNSSSLTVTSATASATVQVTGCAPVSREAAAFSLAATAVAQDSALATQSTSDQAPLTLAVQVNSLQNVTSYAWNTTSSPVASTLRLRYQQTIHAAFIVQYQRSAVAVGYALNGTIIIHNPNLLDAAALVGVQVELYRPGNRGPVIRAWADCPRDAAGVVVVPGQLLGSGRLVCTWNMQLVGAQAALYSDNSNSQLTAVAVTSTGLEYASPAQSLYGVTMKGSTETSTTGECAALSSTFQQAYLGGELLLQPSHSGTGNSLLAGENGGGRAADVVCSSLSVSYGATYGPLSRYQCGTYRTANLASASPTDGTGPLSAATSVASVTVSGCPGALASLSLAGLQLQLLKAVIWNVEGTVAGAAAPLEAAVGQVLDVTFGLRYSADTAQQQRQLAGLVHISASGESPLVLAHLMVEVIPLEADTMTAVPLLTWNAICPKASINGEVTVAAGGSISCSFAGVLPSELVGYGYVTARLQLADGSEAAGPATTFDFSQQPVQSIRRNQCAIVSDHFLFGNGLLQPSRTTRPAAAAAPTQVCNSQSISFSVAVGPFRTEQCGQLLTVINLSRVSPVSASAAQSPISYATIARFNVTGGCPMSQTAATWP